MSAMQDHRSRDSIRDAERYYDIVLALTTFTEKLQQIKEKGFYSINEVFEKLLPDLTDAFKAERGFLAEIVRTPNGIPDNIKLSVVNPDSELCGTQWEVKDRLKDLIEKTTPTVIDPLGSSDRAVIHELGVLNATSAILAKVEAFNKIHVVGVCNKKPLENKKSSEGEPFLAIDGKVLHTIVELIAAGAQVAEQHQLELENILEASRAVNAELDIEELYCLIVENVCQLLDAPAASLMLRDERRQNLVIKAGVGLSPSYEEKQKLPVDLVNKLVLKAQDGEYLVIDNLQEMPVGDRQLIIAEGLFSSLSIKISESEHMIGVLNIYSKNAPREFSAPDIQRAIIFTNQVSVAIHNAQLRKKEIDEASTRLKMLSEVIRAISGTNQLEEGLQALAQSLVNGLKVTFCVIFIFQEQDNYLKLIANFPVSRSQSKEFNWHPDRVKGLDLTAAPAMKQVLTLKDTEIYNISESSHTKKLHHIQESLHIEDRLQTAAAIPLVFDGKSVGLCVIGEVRQWERSPFDPEAMKLAQSVTLGVVQLISFLRAREAEKLFQERMNNLRHLSDEIVQGIIHLKSVLQKTVELACQICDADCGVLYPYLPELKVYDVQNIVHHQLSEVLSIKAKYRTDTEGVAAQILKGKQEQVIVDDVDDGWDRGHELTIELEKNKFVSREKIKAFIALGLFVGDKPVGVLFVNFRQPHKFSEEELDALQIYANQAALTIQQAQLYEEAAKSNRAMQASREITRLISNSQELGEITQSLLSNAVEVTGAEIGKLTLWDESFKPTHQISCRIGSRCEDGGGLTKIEKIASLLERSKFKPNIIPDIQVWRPDDGEIQVEDFHVDADTKSLVIIPILRSKAEKLLGAMLLESKSPVAFNTDEGELLLQLAGYVDIAIQSIENKGEIEDHLKLLEGTLSANYSITGMADSISPVRDTEILLHLIAKNIHETLGCDVIVLYQYYQNNERIDWPPIVAGKLFDKNGVRQFDYVKRTSVVGKIINSQKPH